MNAILALLLLLITPAAFAEPEVGGTSSETWGGGDTVLIDGKRVPRDTADISLCHWKSGTEFATSLKAWPRFMEALSGAHKYYSFRLNAEAAQLKVCLTEGKLTALPTENDDPVVIVGDNVAITALRYRGHVYVNTKLLSEMQDRDQTLLFVHEIMHSFISRYVPGRYERLRAAVRGIDALEHRQIDAVTFKEVLKENRVLWQTEGKTLDRLLALESSESSMESRYGAAVALDRCSRDCSCQLLLRDQVSLVSKWLKQAQLDLREAVMSGNVERVARLMETGLSPKFAIGLFWKMIPSLPETLQMSISPLKQAYALDYAVLTDQPRMVEALLTYKQGPLPGEDCPFYLLWIYRKYASPDILRMLQSSPGLAQDWECDRQHVTRWKMPLVCISDADLQ